MITRFNRLYKIHTVHKVFLWYPKK